jgi:hypothetical protein
MFCSFIKYSTLTPAAHSIVTSVPHEFLHIPLQLQGTTSYFTVRKPTFEEVQSDRDSIHVHMTSDQEWDPYDKTIHHHAEQSIRASSLDQLLCERGRFVSSLRYTAEQSDIEDLEFHSSSVLAGLKSQPTLPVQVEPDLLSEVVKSIASTSTLPLTRKGKILPEDLAKRWDIGVDKMYADTLIGKSKSLMGPYGEPLCTSVCHSIPLDDS